MLLSGYDAIATGHVHQGVQNGEDVEIGLLAGFAGGENLERLLEGAEEHALGRGDHEGSDRGAANDEHFDGLDEHGKRSASGQSPRQRSEHNENTMIAT
jgi:hypothetical protein